MTILWLQPPYLSKSYEGQMARYMQKAGIPLMNMRRTHLTKGMWIKRTKTIYHADPSKKEVFFNAVARFEPTLIIVQDRCALEYITSKSYSLALARGSVYTITLGGNAHVAQRVPCIIIDAPEKINTIRHGGWILANDLQKIKRWHTGTQRVQPLFSYNVCRDASQIKEFRDTAMDSVCMAMDVETAGRGRSAVITLSSYSFLQADGRICNWAIPFYNAGNKTGCHWPSTGIEADIRRILIEVHRTSIPKIMQNGSYDSHYYIRERMPLRNYIFDTAHAFHAIWPEAPKRLDFISSWVCDYYSFWKDLAKEDDKDDKKGDSLVPKTAKGMENYWQYGCLDSYFTLLDGLYLLRLLLSRNMHWALINYVGEFTEQIGPALQSSLQGVRVNKELKDEIERRNQEQAFSALQTLRHMVADEDYNPRANMQTASLLYDVFGAEPIKKAGHKKDTSRSADEKMLKLIQTQHPLLDIIIEQIWSYKKPAGNASKYGQGLWLWNDRWYFKIGTGTTTTWRYNSKASDFWIGTQIQNPPRPGTAVLREIVEPDEGYVLVEKDYSQCDAFFIAFESEEPAYMELMLDERDSHLVHMAQFFHLDYDELVQLRKQHDQATEDGRYDTKRIVHGSNYWMAGFTLFLVLGKRDAERIANRLGHTNAAGWSVQEYVKFCQSLIDFYFDKMYPGLKPWARAEFAKASRNGNKVTAYGGKTRTFFGNIFKDKKVQRELVAFKGQGGTAGLINKAFQNLWYGSWGKNGRNMVLTQTHDSFLAQVPIHGFHSNIAAMNEAMDMECEVHSRKFRVPIDTKIGFGWGKRMMDYNPELSIKDVQQFDREWWQKWESENPPVTTRVMS